MLLEHQSLSLKARSPGPRRQEMTFSASRARKIEPAVAAARGFRRLNDGSLASEPSRYRRRRSRVHLFPDWPQVRKHPVPMGARFRLFEVPAISRFRAALSWAG